jgi:hypothetical protein
MKRQALLEARARCWWGIATTLEWLYRRAWLRYLEARNAEYRHWQRHEH